MVFIQLGDTNVDRLKRIIPALRDALEKLSEDRIEPVIRSVQADIFGYLIKSRFHASHILAQIESPGLKKSENGYVSPFLDNRDTVFVVEVGKDFCGVKNFTKACIWLQRH